MYDSYCAAWPDDLKEANSKWRRAVYKVRCLEAAVTRIDPADFDVTMDALEAAIAEVQRCAGESRRLQHEYNKNGLKF